MCLRLRTLLSSLRRFSPVVRETWGPSEKLRSVLPSRFPVIRFKGSSCLIYTQEHILDLYYIFFFTDRRYINGSGHGSQREEKAGGKTPEDAAGNDEFGAQPKVLRLRSTRPDLRQHDRGLVRLHVLLRHPVSHPSVYLCLSLIISHTGCVSKPSELPSQ